MKKLEESDLINDIKNYEHSSIISTENTNVDMIYSINDKSKTRVYPERLQYSSSSKRLYGNFKCFLFYKNDPLIVIGPDVCYFLLLLSSLFTTFYVIFIHFADRLDQYTHLIGVIVYLIHFISYIITAFKNPGLPSNNHIEEYNSDPENTCLKYEKCSRCESMVNMDGDSITYHCMTCDMCIEKYDHHCPWASKCLGRGNINWFYIFLVSTPIYIVFLLIAVTQMKY